MNIKQIIRVAPLLILASISLSFLVAPTTYALTKQQFVDVLCTGQQGPAQGGQTLAEKCKKDGKKTGKVVIAGKTFKFDDYKNLSKAKFKTEADKKIGSKPSQPTPGGSTTTQPTSGSQKCAGVDTAIIKCSETGEGKNLENNGVWALLVMLIKIMTAGVGILAVAGFGYGAFLWTTAGGSSAQIVKAKETIFNVVVGIVAFALMGALLQFLIPGGVF